MVNSSRDNAPHPCRCTGVVTSTVGDIEDVMSMKLFMSHRDARRWHVGGISLIGTKGELVAYGSASVIWIPVI